MNPISATVSSPTAAANFLEGDSLALSELMGYREDAASQLAFERRQLPFVVPGVLIAFGSFYLLFTDRISLAMGMLGFVVGWLICLASVVRAWRAIPTSQISGRPMLRFRRTDGSAENTEFIYVDPESRTYFCRVVSTSS